MNKKTKTKILTLSAISALSLAAIWVLASNPNDLLNFEWEVKQDAHLELSGLSLTTDPTTPQATSKSDVSWTVNDGKLITHTRTNTSTNQISANGTLSFWGSNNNTSDPESLILGGSSNEITDTAKANIIAASQWVKTAGEGTTNHGTGNVILASSGVNLTGNGNILRAGNNTKIHGNDNLTFATDKVKISANNSIVIGGNITINDNGSFVFNGTPDPVTTKKPNTAIINTSNGMIINTETKTATNTDLTISGSLQVGIGSQIDKPGAIISDRCIKLKDIFNGEIGLECREHTNFWGETSLPKTPKCGRNATKYTIHDSNWRGTNKADFCSEGALEISPENKRFRTLLERTTATGKGMYATKGFTYDFTICFWDGNPLCAPKKLSKTWRCKTPEGNAIRCEANLQIKKMECDTKTHHFEDVNQTNWSTNGDQWQCLPNIKLVACDNSQRLDTTHGLFPNATVKVQRNNSKRNYTAPEPCVLKCEDGYHLADNNTRCESNTREVPCENRNHVINTEWGRIANAKYEERRDSENWRPKTKVCHLNCNEGGVLNTAKTACEQKREEKVCNQTFSDWKWLIPTNTGTKLTYYRDPNLRRIPDAKLCDFSCKPWYNKDATNRRCVRCDASHNRDASSESCVKKQVSCSGNQPPHSIPNTKAIAPEQPNTPVELVSPGSTKACSYICQTGYILGKDSSENNACLKCQDWTRDSSRKTCKVMASCNPWYTNDPQNPAQCVAIWNCMINGEIDWHYNTAQNRIAPNNFQPLQKNLERQYVDKNPEAYKCQFTCEKGQVVDGNKQCANRRCFGSSQITDSPDMESYINLKSNNIQDSVFVDIEVIKYQDLQDKKDKQVKGCFYACKNSKIFYNGKCLSEKEKQLAEQEEREKQEENTSKKSCEFSYLVMENTLNSFYEIIRKPTRQSEKFVYQDPLPSTPWCFYKCKNGATATEISSYPMLKRCIPQEPKSCANNEIRSPWNFITDFIWSCRSCDNWYEPDLVNNLVNGKPTTCKQVNCGDDAIWNLSRKSCIAKLVYAACPTGFSRTQKDNTVICERCLFNQILTENGCVDKNK